MPRARAVLRPEVGERAAREVVIDDDRADVRGARDGGRVAELVADASHHGRERSLRVRLRLGAARVSRAPSPRAACRPRCGSPSPCTRRRGSRARYSFSSGRRQIRRARRRARSETAATRPAGREAARHARRASRSSIVRRTSLRFFARKQNAISSPETETCRFLSVVTPYVLELRACRSEPTRNHALLMRPTATAHVQSCSYGSRRR